MKKSTSIYCLVIFSIILSCKTKSDKETEVVPKIAEVTYKKGEFGFDKEFLKNNYKNTFVLENTEEQSAIIISPELQGRVMTSSLQGDRGNSFGWLNYELIQSKEIKEHINPTGGEERFWLGPEGGQYFIFFAPETSFDFDNWYVPASLDTEAFSVKEKNSSSVSFHKEMQLINHSGTKFSLEINRKIILLNKTQIRKVLNIGPGDFRAVAYQTENEIKNIGKTHWEKDSGLLSIWLLSMLNPSSKTTVVVPIKEGSIEEKGPLVNDDYFGEIAADRLQRTEQTIYYKADGNSRGKIGVSALRSTGIIGSYDAYKGVLTILEIDEPDPNQSYVNSAWELQDKPYVGDVLNSYNDGKLEDGAQMGPFYELESSSPALALKSGESYTHTQRVYHFQGERRIINEIALNVLKVSLDEIETALE